ncbi:hypothetical protein VHEMI09902 [[Torrubiella] hemipterigena]|uniref:Heme haloperoxidase family profile domain-containing protein n=1 Tax=[Torrubiella] hemipterigena TaxID=1531966 RepID=A0A0A1TQW3_9HYPO|nr:hypothetical protein VHEMI09902 [[Torrubiella] hemipterigena]
MLWFTAIALFVARVVAQPTDNHAFQAPGPGDVRSPCPGLNALANHGFLPRNGKGVTLQNFITGLKEGINVGIDFALPVGQMALQSAPLPLALSVDLDRLAEHNYLLEHDASLSRQDFYLGDDLHFNQSIFDQVLAYYKGTDTTNIQAASDARWARVKDSLTTNPKVVYGVRQLVLSYGETALYMAVMGDPLTGKAPISFVKSLIEKERLPYEQGWTKPAVEVNLVTLGALIAQLQLANPDAVPEGLTLGAGTLKDVYNLIDPLTGQALNLTCAVLGLC